MYTFDDVQHQRQRNPLPAQARGSHHSFLPHEARERATRRFVSFSFRAEFRL